MKVSENTLKWAMRLYPPLFFQRIWVRRFHKDYRGVDVKINHSILNRNYNRSIFGGTIFAATDPFYAILFEQILKRKGYKTVTWLKSAEIKYTKPARNDLFFTITIENNEILAAETKLNSEGKYITEFTLDVFDRKGQLCAKVKNEIYIRNLNFDRHKY